MPVSMDSLREGLQTPHKWPSEIGYLTSLRDKEFDLSMEWFTTIVTSLGSGDWFMVHSYSLSSESLSRLTQWDPMWFYANWRFRPVARLSLSPRAVGRNNQGRMPFLLYSNTNHVIKFEYRPAQVDPMNLCSELARVGQNNDGPRNPFTQWLTRSTEIHGKIHHEDKLLVS